MHSHIQSSVPSVSIIFLLLQVFDILSLMTGFNEMFHQSHRLSTARLWNVQEAELYNHTTHHNVSLIKNPTTVAE